MRMQATVNGDFVRLVGDFEAATALDPMLAERIAGELTEAVKTIRKRKEVVPGAVFRDENGDVYIGAGEEVGPGDGGRHLLWCVKTGTYADIGYWEAEGRRFTRAHKSSGTPLTIRGPEER